MGFPSGHLEMEWPSELGHAGELIYTLNSLIQYSSKRLASWIIL